MKNSLEKMLKLLYNKDIEKEKIKTKSEQHHYYILSISGAEMYQDLSGTKKFDYRYLRNGEYTDEQFDRKLLRRKEIKRSSGFGTVCISCGISRSRSNKCECNS
jgi:hypothetical protein